MSKDGIHCIDAGHTSPTQVDWGKEKKNKDCGLSKQSSDAGAAREPFRKYWKARNWQTPLKYLDTQFFTRF
jgi:hypothetical protein